MSSNKKFRIQNGAAITGEVTVNDQVVITEAGIVTVPAISAAVATIVASDIATLQSQVDAILGTSPESLNTLQEIVSLFQSEDGDIQTLITNNSTAITAMQATLSSGVAGAADFAALDLLVLGLHGRGSELVNGIGHTQWDYSIGYINTSPNFVQFTKNGDDMVARKVLTGFEVGKTYQIRTSGDQESAYVTLSPQAYNNYADFNSSSFKTAFHTHSPGTGDVLTDSGTTFVADATTLHMQIVGNTPNAFRLYDISITEYNVAPALETSSGSVVESINELHTEIGAEAAARTAAIAAIPGTDLTPYSTTAQMDSSIATAKSEAQTYADQVVASTIDAAPAALDTLNELAAALGDDANFASTVTASIATKATAADLTALEAQITGTAVQKSDFGTGIVSEADSLVQDDMSSNAPTFTSQTSLTAPDPQPSSRLFQKYGVQYGGQHDTFQKVGDWTIVGVLNGDYGQLDVYYQNQTTPTYSYNSASAIFGAVVGTSRELQGPASVLTETHVYACTWENGHGNIIHKINLSTGSVDKSFTIGSDSWTQEYQGRPQIIGDIYYGVFYGVIIKYDMSTDTQVSISAASVGVSDLNAYTGTSISGNIAVCAGRESGILHDGFVIGVNLDSGTKAFAIHSPAFESGLAGGTPSFQEPMIIGDKVFLLANNYVQSNQAQADLARMSYDISTDTVSYHDLPAGALGSGSVAVSARQVSIGDYLALHISDKSGVSKVYFYHKDDLDTLVHTHSFGLNEHPQFNRGGLYVTDVLNAHFVRMTGTGIVTLEITKVALSGTAVSGSILVDQSVIASKVYVDAETAARTAAIAAIPATDLTPYSTTAEMNSAITAEVANVVDAAPAALDTLNELAAALGDDANFASTITTSIATKATAADLTALEAQITGGVATLAQGALADTALQPADLVALESKTTGVAYDASSTNVDVEATLDMQTNAIINVAAPSAADDAATKAYVDAETTARGTAITSAISTASADATTKADQAEVDAKAYADQVIVSIIDAAPASLNTLNELATALGDDANFASTVTASIATKADDATTTAALATKASVTDVTALDDLVGASEVVTDIGHSSSIWNTFDHNVQPYTMSNRRLNMVSPHPLLMNSTLDAGTYTFTFDSGINGEVNVAVLDPSWDFSTASGSYDARWDNSASSRVAPYFTAPVYGSGQSFTFTLSSPANLAVRAMASGILYSVSLVKVAAAPTLDTNASVVIPAINELHSEISAETTARGTAITSAISTASADATVKADQAEADAKAYADQVVASTIDAAPAALDTLNELAAALGDDANFASTVTASIATKADGTTTTASIATAKSEAIAGGIAGAKAMLIGGLCITYDPATGTISIDETETAAALHVASSGNANALGSQSPSHYRIDVYDVNGTIVN